MGAVGVHVFYAVGDSTYVFRGFSQVEGGGLGIYLGRASPQIYSIFAQVFKHTVLKGTVQQDFLPTGFFLI